MQVNFVELEQRAATKGTRVKKELLSVSLLPGEKKTFIDKCESRGANPGDLLRAFVEAYNNLQG